MLQDPKRSDARLVDLDHDFYRTYHPDVRERDNDGVVAHYLAYGLNEGRAINAAMALAQLEKSEGLLPQDFDEREYYSLNNDVRNVYSFPLGGAIHYLKFGKKEGRRYVKNIKEYDEHLLNLLTNRIYDMPDVVVKNNAPKRINILVPAFDFNTMSAGFFGVFQISLFIKRNVASPSGSSCSIIFTGTRPNLKRNFSDIPAWNPYSMHLK